MKETQEEMRKLKQSPMIFQQSRERKKTYGR